MKILLLDIETAPNLAYVWRLFDTTVGIDMLLESHYILCWSAKWLGKEEVMFASRENQNAKAMLKPLHQLLHEADAVIHYNGKKFDIPHINREFLLNEFPPPSPYKQIDLRDTAKQVFKFPSNKLQQVAKELEVGSKIKHDGFELWVGCIEKDPVSWQKMQEYNIQDVLLLEKVYEKLRPWVRHHTNHGVVDDSPLPICPVCGSTHIHKRGFYNTLSSKFQRYQCNDCGHWSRDNVIVNRKQHKVTSIL